ncbi:MAG: glycosyltransferase family 4 protein [Flavobacteriales bacterium]|nr:glycosyltransferase family 4 protein [Flavobacteriales bacterium]
MTKPKVLVFIDWYLPGYKAGGPVRSMANLVDHLRDRVDLHIVTTNADYTEQTPYTGVTSDSWTTLPGGEKVWYASTSGVNKATWRKILWQENWATVYINGLYSRWFSVMPLWLLRGSSLRRVVAARGMLAKGMMKHGSLKKRAFLAVMKLLGCYKDVIFQGTNVEEVEDVKHWIGAATTVHLVSNLGRQLKNTSPAPRTKIPGEIRLLSVARIAVEKNTLFAIQCLEQVNGKVTYDLYGPIYDQAYWKQCEAAIAKLPSSIAVTYKGAIAPEAVGELFTSYHALFMPSQGENFGHTMVEALASGLPLLISDRTPWRELEPKRAGWDLSIDGRSLFTEAAQRLVEMDQTAYDPWTLGAFRIGERYLNDPVPVNRTLELIAP